MGRLGEGWSSASEVAEMTAQAACPCPTSLDSNFLWSSQLQEIEEGEAEKEVVDESGICDVAARTEKVCGGLWPLFPLLTFLHRESGVNC